MTRSRLIAAAMALGLVGFATGARADLLDEDDSVKPAAPKPAPTEPQTAPTPGAKPMTPAAKPPPTKPVPKIDDDEPTLKAPTPHAKDSAPNGSTTVIPPKKPGAPAKPGAKRENEPVHFDSKGLKGLRNKGKVELTQDVVVTQGEMRVEADHAEVFFDEGAKDKKDRGLLKVVAEGNPVKITGVDENSGERFRAFGNSAVFLAKERTVVLEGNARLHRGDDSVIRSKKITYEMNSGWIKADRVAGELQPQAAGIGAGRDAGSQAGAGACQPVGGTQVTVTRLPARPANGEEPLELKAEELEKWFKTRQVVKSASFTVKQGEVVGLLGPNGAGKTTSFYMVVGLLYPSKGKVFMGDEEITHLPMHVRAKKGISYLPQNMSIFRKMTVEDNLRSVMEVCHVPRDERPAFLDELLGKFQIRHISKSLGASLSGGERRRVEIARALIIRPKFLLLDEPFAGIDPMTVQEIQGIIGKLRDEGLGVLITDHNVRETLGSCDRAYILSGGQIIAHGLPEEVSSSQTVREIYLGENFKL